MSLMYQRFRAILLGVLMYCRYSPTMLPINVYANAITAVFMDSYHEASRHLQHLRRPFSAK